METTIKENWKIVLLIAGTIIGSTLMIIFNQNPNF
jgi:hypothetical protein